MRKPVERLVGGTPIFPGGASGELGVRGVGGFDLPVEPAIRWESYGTDDVVTGFGLEGGMGNAELLFELTFMGEVFEFR